MERPGGNDARACQGLAAEQADPTDVTPFPHVLCQPWRMVGRGNPKARKAAGLGTPAFL
jgi:hypothetical protein